jgi:RND family efflux transporter MFP subunit
MKKIISSTLCIFALSTVLMGCNVNLLGANGNSDVANVKVSKVKTSDSISNTIYTANVTSAEKVNIVPSTSGKIETVDVEVGQIVNKDDQLFTIDSTELQYRVNQAQANYDAAAVAYNKVATASIKQTQIDTATTLQKAQNELKDATNAYNVARSQLNNNTTVLTAQTTYNDAKANYDRVKALYETNATSKVSLDDAKSKLDTSLAALEIAKTNAQTLLDNAESRLDNAKTSVESVTKNASITNTMINQDNIAAAQAQLDSTQAALDIAKHQLSNAVVTTPIAGVISAKNISVGEMAPTQTPSIVIENSNAVNVVIKVTETKINDVVVGMPVKLTVPSTGLSYDGIVSTIAPEADVKTGMFEVKVAVNNANKQLKLGMVTNVTLVNPAQKKMILVPKKSVINEDNTSYVYVINGDKLAKRTVTVGQIKNQYIEVKEGLTEEDTIVVEGSSNMKDNGKFNIVRSN